MAVCVENATFLGQGSFGMVVGLVLSHPDFPGVTVRTAVKCVQFIDTYAKYCFNRSLPPSVQRRHVYDADMMVGEIAAECVLSRLAAALDTPVCPGYLGEFVSDGAVFHPFLRGEAPEDSVLARIGTALTSVLCVNGGMLCSARSDESWMFLCMEWIDSARPLSQLQGFLSGEEIRLIVFQVAYALFRLFRSFRAYHRDLWGKNILIGGGGSSSATEEEEEERPLTVALDDGVHFRVAVPSSCCATLIDFGFGTYAETHMDGNARRAPASRTDVNRSNACVTTQPSPDLFFFPEGQMRTAWTDVFALGMLVLRAFLPPAFAWPDHTPLEDLLVEAQQELKHEHYYGQLLQCLLVLDALGNSDPATGLPPSPLFADTPLYGFLAENAMFRLWFDVMRKQNPVRDVLAALAPECITFLRDTLTWTAPEMGTNPFETVLRHPYFASYRVAAAAANKAPPPATETGQMGARILALAEEPVMQAVLPFRQRKLEAGLTHMAYPLLERAWKAAQVDDDDDDVTLGESPLKRARLSPPSPPRQPLTLLSLVADEELGMLL